jgi:hypothetical protein
MMLVSLLNIRSYSAAKSWLKFGESCRSSLRIQQIISIGAQPPVLDSAWQITNISELTL